MFAVELFSNAAFVPLGRVFRGLSFWPVRLRKERFQVPIKVCRETTVREKKIVYLESWCKHKKCFSYGVRHSIPTLRICCAKLRKAGFQKDGGRLDLGFVLFDFLYLFLLAFEKYVVPWRTVPSFRNHSVSDTSPL